MNARRAVRTTLSVTDADQGQTDLRQARTAVDAAKVALGERGPVWWTDGAPDYNRHMAKNSPYAAWFEGLES